MTAAFPAKRSLRRFSGVILALLPIILAMWSMTARSAEPANVQSKPQKPELRHTATKAKHKSAHASKANRSAKSSKRKRTKSRSAADAMALQSRSVLVIDQDTGETLESKNPNIVVPIASLTKLMTALVVMDSHLPMDEVLQISSDDLDTEKNTHSRLKIGTRLSRDQMLLLALMSSENRAALSLSRNYPGGRSAFIARMNQKAQAMGMTSSHFADPAGLSSQSVSTAHDLHRLLSVAYAQPLIRKYSTQTQSDVRVNKRMLKFVNSNRLVRKKGDWHIELQKTGFTNEAGRCLVMQATVLGRRLAMIFLDSTGTLTRYADAARVRRRVELNAHALTRKVIGTATVVATP